MSAFHSEISSFFSVRVSPFSSYFYVSILWYFPFPLCLYYIYVLWYMKFTCRVYQNLFLNEVTLSIMFPLIVMFISWEFVDSIKLKIANSRWKETCLKIQQAKCQTHMLTRKKTCVQCFFFVKELCRNKEELKNKVTITVECDTET